MYTHTYQYNISITDAGARKMALDRRADDIAQWGKQTSVPPKWSRAQAAAFMASYNMI